MTASIRRTIALIAVALPSFAVSAASDKPLPADQAVAACVEFKEKAVACKEVLADYFASFAPAEKRQRLREKAMQEIVAEGTGPLEPRQAKCAESQARQPYTEAEATALRACAAKTDCQAQLDCAKPLMSKMTGRSKKR
jgi:hypothetical protein